MDGTIWAVLGVSPGASADDIKAAFRARARVEHPDHGGDPTRFRRLVDAQRHALAAAPAPATSAPATNRFITASSTAASAVHSLDLTDVNPTGPKPRRPAADTGVRTFDDVLAEVLAA